MKKEHENKDQKNSVIQYEKNWSREKKKVAI